MSLKRFVEKWTNSDYPPDRVLAENLREAEIRLGFEFPIDYKNDVLEIGLPKPTIALLNAIVEQEINVVDPGDFYSPDEIVIHTMNWREIGMPDHLVAFAGDGGGNQICFTTSRLGVDGQGVWFFDHDFGTVEEIAASFSAWVDALCDVEPWVDE